MQILHMNFKSNGMVVVNSTCSVWQYEFTQHVVHFNSVSTAVLYSLSVSTLTSHDAIENADADGVGVGVPEVRGGLERDLPGEWPTGQSAGEHDSPDPARQVQGHHRQRLHPYGGPPPGWGDPAAQQRHQEEGPTGQRQTVRVPQQVRKLVQISRELRRGFGDYIRDRGDKWGKGSA